MSRKVVVLMTMLMMFSGMVSAMDLTGGPVVNDEIMPTIDHTIPTIGPLMNHSSDEGKYDTIGYEIFVGFDLDNKELIATANITLRALADITALNLTLIPSLDVSRIRDGALTPLTYYHNKTRLNLTVNITESVGSLFNLTIDYGGNTSSTHGNDPVEWNGTLLRRSVAWYPRPLDRSLPFLPRPSQIDKYNYTIHASVPDNWTAISIGELVGSVDEGPTKNFTYRSIDPVTEATMAAANYTTNTTTHAGVTLTTYLFKQNATQSGLFMGAAKQILTWYTGMFAGFPYNDLRMVQVTEELDNTLGDQALIFSDDFDRTTAPTYDIVEAISEQYFLQNINTQGQYDAWLTYGLHEYSMSYYQLQVDGKNSLIKGHRNYDRFDGDSIRDLSSNNNNFREVMEDKGAYVFHMLRYLIGNTSFDAIMDEYATNAMGTIADIVTFMDAVDANTAIDLTWFWDRWLNATNTNLDYTVVYPGKVPQIYLDDGQLKVDVTIKKEGNAAMPIDLQLELESGDPMLFSKILDRDTAEQTFTINVTGDVTNVVIDPLLWILEMDDSDNEAVPERDDIVVKDLTLDPDTDITEGDAVTITATIQNNGDHTHDVMVRFFDNGTAIGTDSLTNLYAGNEGTAEVTWDSVMGERVIEVFADSDEVIMEFNESNNKLNTTISIAELIPPPDLYFDGDMTFYPDNVTEGSLVNATVTVFNDYKLSVTGVTISFYVNGLPLSNDTLGMIPANSTQAVTVSWVSKPGTHTIKAVMEAPFGLVESDKTNNEIEGQVKINQIPVAKLEVDEDNPLTNEEVEFTAAMSIDDALLKSYYFDFGDGTFRNWSAEVTAKHSYADSGTYSARVKVIDSLDIESEWSDPVVITVQNTLPIASFDIYPKDGTVYTTFTFKSTSHDPDGEVKKFMWEFGDGKTVIEETRNFTTHQYDDDKEFTVRLIVVDDDGQNSQPITKTVVINNVRPNVKGTISKTEVYPGDPVTLDASGSWDDDDDKSDLTFEWKAEGKVLSKQMKATNIKFTTVGDYKISLTVTDDDGKSNSTTLDLKVIERPGGNGNGGDEPQGLSMALIGGIVGIVVVVVVVLLFVLMGQAKKKKEATEAAAAKPKKKPKKTKKVVADEEEDGEAVVVADEEVEEEKSDEEE